MSDDDKQQLEDAVLEQLEKGPINDTRVFLQERKCNLSHEVLVGVLQSLVACSFVVVTEGKDYSCWQLTEEGQGYLKEGTPEYRTYSLLAIKGQLSREQLEEEVGASVANIGWAQCIQKKWAKIAEGSLVKITDVPGDEVQRQLQQVANGSIEPQLAPDSPEAKIIEGLKKRKLVVFSKSKTLIVQQGEKYARQRPKLATDLSLDMFRDGSWADEQWKEYNFNAKAKIQPGGALHPLLKVRAEFRRILMEMGFEEMPTNRFVENSFWNFDALFVPQKHPARDSQDTFFLADPATSTGFPKDYVERVKKVHEVGGFGSIGYRYDWHFEETKKNILRTHTTAISSKMLYNLAQQKKFEPKRYFSIDRVFRNETLDPTHLAEFHQVEGLIADFGLTLGDLIGVIESFFRRIGITNLRFKPAYNPYTEPSMEIFSYSPQLDKWMEVGNSGIFRPEMLLPMGLPEGVNVIAWGLSLERPTMIKYGIGNIRDLFGPNVKLDIIAKNPIARYDHAV